MPLPRHRLSLLAAGLGLWLALWPVVPATAAPALWVVKSEDATFYLFGTTHVLKPGTKWQTPPIARAFGESGELWVEVADENPDTLKTLIVKLGVDSAHPLSSKLGEDDLERVDTVAKTAGMPGEAALEPMRPWLAALTLVIVPIVQSGYDPAQGVDKALRAQAAAAGKPVRGLETVEEQLHIFADLPPPVELDLLRSTLDEVAEGPAKIQSMIAAWEKGDTKELEKAFVELTEEKYHKLYDVLIVKRNEAWADRIAKQLGRSHGTIFIAVGVGHLVGRDSVQNILERRGIKSVRITD